MWEQRFSSDSYLTMWCRMTIPKQCMSLYTHKYSITSTHTLLQLPSHMHSQPNTPLHKQSSAHDSYPPPYCSIHSQHHIIMSGYPVLKLLTQHLQNIAQPQKNVSMWDLNIVNTGLCCLKKNNMHYHCEHVSTLHKHGAQSIALPE